MTNSKLDMVLLEEEVLLDRTPEKLSRYRLEFVLMVEEGMMAGLVYLNNIVKDKNCRSDMSIAMGKQSMAMLTILLEGMEPRNTVVDNLGGSY